MFRSLLESTGSNLICKYFNPNYFIDKVLNNNSIDYDKDWSELESFRDKYLVVRLIFDNFAEHTQHENGTVKMLMNFSMESETNSSR